MKRKRGSRVTGSRPEETESAVSGLGEEPRVTGSRPSFPFPLEKGPYLLWSRVPPPTGTHCDALALINTALTTESRSISLNHIAPERSARLRPITDDHTGHGHSRLIHHSRHVRASQKNICPPRLFDSDFEI
ncbi:hypothetical protein EYF80_039151 [Liparis tanakae]|uniref:Uncharacterized protein n=1 Tax=Liparis tanakae TaxID=230148 RepID=A0A4Z2GAR3_9TELE|nr:hypothetical protein EYF80_039151 [Liparis tanakae]